MAATDVAPAGGTVYTGEQRERFIPVSKQEVAAELMEHGHLDGEKKELFERFVSLFSALYHYHFHKELETLKEAYRPFSPDPDTITNRKWSEEELLSKRKTFLGAMRKILDDANYEMLTVDDINEALKEESPYGVTVYVDLDDFDELMLFYRGSAVRIDEKRAWKKLYLKKERFETPVYKRLALVVKLKPECVLKKELQEGWGLGETKAARLARKRRRGVATAMDEEAIYLKLFKDIPRYDLEMLFPNTRVRMSLFDRIRVGVTGGGATAFGAYKVIASLLAASAIGIGAIGILFGFFGLLGRQVSKIFTLRTKYMVKLSQNLYLQNLDNNAGVFTHLVDLAEEEECKEAILAYYFLLVEKEKRHQAESLDQRIEGYLSHRYAILLDFEIEDGLRKLRERGLLVEERDGTLGVLPLLEACTRLDEEWDNFFQFNVASD